MSVTDPATDPDSVRLEAADTLAERLTAGLIGGSAANEDVEVVRRLRRWRDQPPFTAAAWWRRRLATDGLDDGRLAQLLATPVPPCDRPWQRALSTPEASDPGQTMAEVEPGFAALAAPLLRPARERLRTRLRPAGDRIDTEQVLADLYRPLPDLVHRMLTRTLLLELNIARLDDALPGADQAARYDAFVAGLDGPGRRRELYARYPVLARQLTVATDQWLASASLLVERLLADWDVIEDTLGGGPLGTVTGVRTGLGDRHRNGQSVSAVTWSSGLTLVYKPRSMAVDVHFGRLVEWLNARGLSTPLRTAEVLDRGEYGWARHITATPCRDQDQLRGFYRRQGCLLALLYVLRASDFHAENVIAVGEFPVPVDLESLLEPGLPLRDPAATPAEQDAAEAVESSVLAVGLLPQPVFDPESAQVVDLSGLGQHERQQSPVALPTLVDAGADTMRIELSRREQDPTAHRPVAPGTDLDLARYAEDITAGFAELYRLCVRHRETLAAGPLAAFGADEVRVILRATLVYSTILQTGFHPSVLGDGLERDRHFDALWRDVPRIPALAYAIPAERRDLWRNDIPVFTTTPREDQLYDSEGAAVPGLTVEPGLRRAQRRLAELDEADLDRQLWLVRGAIGTTLLDANAVVSMRRYRHDASAAPADPDDLIAAADRIGQHLTRIAFDTGGSAQWLGVNANQGLHWSMGPLFPDLFHGLTGIALFLAQLGVASGEPAYSALARRTVATIDVQVGRGLLAGDAGMAGLPGVAYGYAHLAALWQDEALLDRGYALLPAIAAAVPEDTEYDLVGGAAGTIACLRSLHRLRPRDELLQVISAAADHLLAHATRHPTGIGWLSPTVAALGRTALPIAGFSHGQAGIAWLLYEAGVLLGEDRYTAAADAAVEYEQALFDPDSGTWREHRDLASFGVPDDTPPGAFWCYGGSGIALGRLLCWPYLESAGPAGASRRDTARREVDAGLAAVRADGFGHGHSLCHGDLGNLELLLHTTPLPDEEVRRRATAVTASFDTVGWLCGTPTAVQTPGLMSGLAGIGYGLLRAAGPWQTPSIVTLQPPH